MFSVTSRKQNIKRHEQKSQKAKICPRRCPEYETWSCWGLQPRLTNRTIIQSLNGSQEVGLNRIAAEHGGLYSRTFRF